MRRRLLEEISPPIQQLLFSGKHVYCEKPLTRTVHESRALRELARQYQVATSMGNQGTAADRPYHRDWRRRNQWRDFGTCQLGNGATQSEGALEFDPVAMRISNSPGADALLSCEYRSGWEL